MKTLRVLFILTILLPVAEAHARTMVDIPGFPVAGMRSYLPAGVFAQLEREPVKAWILLRGQIVGGKVSGARVIHSEAGGVYDKVAVQMANGMQLYTDVTSSRVPPSVAVHMLVYQLPKGEHAIALAQDDSLGGSNLTTSHSLRMRFLGLANQKAPASNRKKN
ncbi:MAG TPA: hypothetical protein VM940_14550 [Chthoniobacterales bacterium]|nr:hypothetical protein [Chthoniobacterales bacterium]